MESKLALSTAVCLALVLSTPARAERPMTVEDAGTLAAGGAKLEAGWSRDAHLRGGELVAGMAPFEHLEIEVAHARGHDHHQESSLAFDGNSFAVKWVPWQQESGFSAGLKLSHGRERERTASQSPLHHHGNALNTLLTWRDGAGSALHANLGRAWSTTAGERLVETTWGVGYELPLAEALVFTLETWGTRHAAPDRAIGVRYQLREGLKVSAAFGQGNARTLVSTGIAWEF